METLPIQSVEICFADGSRRTITVEDTETGFYKREHCKGPKAEFETHNVFIVNGQVRDIKRLVL